MAALQHTIRIRTTEWKFEVSPVGLQRIVNQINSRALAGQAFGELSPTDGGRLSLAAVTHKILPTARILGSTIIVEVEVLDTHAGALLREFIRSGMSVQGVIRGIVDAAGDIVVHSVDVDTRPPSEFTVLDDILEALDGEDLTGP